MPEQNDVNSDNPVITDSGVVEPAPTADVSQVDAGKGEQPKGDVTPAAAAAPAGQVEEPKGPVPYDRFAEVNTKKNELQAQVDQLQGHLKLVGNQPQPQAEQPAQKEGLTIQVMKQMGIDPEYATPPEQAKVNDAVMQIMVGQITTQNQQQQFLGTHADFAQVVGTEDPVTKQFVYAPPLARVLAENPSLITALQNAGAGANALAYQIAVKDPTYQQQLAEQAKPAQQIAGESAEQAIKAAASLQSVSSVGAPSGVIDKGAQFRAMTNEQIAKHGEQVIQQGGGASPL